MKHIPDHRDREFTIGREISYLYETESAPSLLISRYNPSLHPTQSRQVHPGETTVWRKGRKVGYEMYMMD